MSELPKVNLNHTALVTIDLQDNILVEPAFSPATIDSILTTNDQLAERFKNTDALIVPVTVNVNNVAQMAPSFQSHSKITTLANDAHPLTAIVSDPDADNVVTVTKNTPDAFFGTDLDLQLRRRGIDTIILTGVSTSNGVYATALSAYHRAFQVLVVQDACADRDAENHTYFFEKLFSRIGWVTTSQELL